MAKVRKHYKKYHKGAKKKRRKTKGRRQRVSFPTASGKNVSFLARRSKGQITIVGILTIVITLMVFAMTLPIQIEQIGIMLNTTNDTTTRLIYNSLIPIEGIMILMGIVYYGSQAREQFRGYIR